MSDTAQKPPFGWLLIWGKKATGKTVAALNSPWQPVHVIDCENSSGDYFEHQARLVETGFLKGAFTRTMCYTLQEYLNELVRITKSTERYGTIVVDTFGQVANWIGEDQFKKEAGKADKQSQIVWGHVRDRIRTQLLELGKRCDLLVVTAHERKYGDDITPRCNPTVLELCSLSVRLTRQPNEKMPTATIKARLPFFPPQIKDFTIGKLVDYIQKPANWDKLSEDEKLAEPSPTPQPGFDEKRQYEEG